MRPPQTGSFWRGPTNETTPQWGFGGEGVTGPVFGDRFSTQKTKWENYTASIWEFAQDMYYKQPKKDEYGYHLGTVNVIPNHSQKRLAEIQQCYVKARD